MNKKIALLIILCLVGTIAIATAAKPDLVPPGTPNLLDMVDELNAMVADLQTSVSGLWVNATAQQSQITQLQTNASEQQAAIDAIQSGTATHFGEWDQTFVANTTYQAQTDGFVFAKAPVDPYDPSYPNNWIAVEIRTSANAGFSPMINIHDKAHASVDDWAEAIFPVKEGDYWIVYGWDGNGAAHDWVAVYWLPLNTS